MLNEIDTLDANYVEALWRNTLRLIGGIVLEDEARFSQAVEGFSEAVRHDLHPDGYVRKAAVDGDPALSLHRMLLAVQALILCAEAASHAGQDLWALSQRGVSVLTPLPYLLYYYYYPEKWRWDVEVEVEGVPEAGLASLDPQAVQGFYRQHAGLWEMAQHHSLSPDRQRLLDELRPIFDLWGGGLVTLSHGAEPVRHRRFGLF